ncbi:hypothetical protein L5470_01445 [Synechococcus sp. PCC 6717]|jgi:hypothetical protein|uniref:Gas vesicle protein n=1 Tax=Parathermosynechococcus lividus PCC 6715 TaxID=1917166 RepID=A0A2D2Q568_PARLV|nr:hypothetical protein [Thermostichus lividus]ATS19643.1 hypothetical protein BRW62_11755 [Thermostichus lividus PCC 6715]MCH9056396.1 hypothetical protein [Synechococcus sp. PCC 6716]MCI3279656.1 hypothetical protein [Synechococcus sp. PCC 6717]
MDNRGDRFGWGFLAGALFGGIAGSLISLLLKEKLTEISTTNAVPLKGAKAGDLNSSDETLMESMRLELEAKIAQINEAVDDLQSRLSTDDNR